MGLRIRACFSKAVCIVVAKKKNAYIQVLGDNMQPGVWRHGHGQGAFQRNSGENVTGQEVLGISDAKRGLGGPARHQHHGTPLYENGY